MSVDASLWGDRLQTESLSETRTWDIQDLEHIIVCIDPVVELGHPAHDSEMLYRLMTPPPFGISRRVPNMHPGKAI
jgi:hypothetical protein